MSLAAAAALGLAAALALMGAVWAASLPLRDASLVDRFWGVGLIAVAGVYQAAYGLPAHGWPVLALVALWGARLSLYLAWRGWGQGEDPRYRALREQGGPRWAWRSLVSVFGLQAVALWLLSAPLLYAIARGSAEAWLSAPALLGAALFAAGWCYEAVADGQLARFRADPASRGRVLERGLWRYSRHPNYFGEILVWWGLWGFALAAGGWWTAFSPVLITTLLARVTGVPLLEARLREDRPGYAEYAARTNALIPGPPRRRQEGRR